EPAVVHVGHPDTLRLRGDRVLTLLLRADEEHRAVAGREAAPELVGLLEQHLRLLEVDDVDPPALGEDEPLHLRIPAAGLVAEVDSGLQELTHGDDGHSAVLSGWLVVLMPAGPRWNRRAARPVTPAPPPVRPPGRRTKNRCIVAASRRLPAPLAGHCH